MGLEEELQGYEKIARKAIEDFGLFPDFMRMDVEISDEYEVNLDPIVWRLSIRAPPHSAQYVYSLVIHELGHWKFCPSSLYYEEKILQGVSKVVSGDLAFYLSEMFEDVIVNAVSSLLFRDFSKGMFHFLRFSKGKANTAFFVINMHLWGHLVSKGETKVKGGVGKCIEACLQSLFGDWRHLSLEEKVWILMRREQWEEKAEEFVRCLYPLFKRYKTQFNFYTEKVKELEVRKEFSRMRILRGEKPLYLSDFESLDALYTFISPEIEIEEEKKREGYGTPISMLSLRRFERDDSLKDVEWGQTRVIGDEFLLFVPDYSFSSDIQGDSQGSFIPDLCFLVDSSGSMGIEGRFDPWERKGKYHYLLCSVYGILKYLERRGKAQKMKFNCLNFSSSTISSGWRNYFEIEEVKKILFQFQGKRTTPDGGKIKEMSTHGEYLVIMITDGELQNFKKVKDTFECVMEKGEFALINCGTPNEFTDFVSAKGEFVKVVHDSADIQSIAIRLAKRYY